MTLPSQLQQTLPYLIDRWLPVNPEILFSLEKRCSSDSEKPIETGELLRELRQDPALLCWCLIGNHNPAENPDLGDHLASRVRQLIQHVRRGETLHQLNQATPLQQNLLRRTLARVSASTTLARYLGVDTNMACMVDSLKEVGASLIAWNYPHIFSRTLLRAETDRVPAERRSHQINTWLAMMLGFSPALLARALGRQSIVAEDVRRCLEPSTELPSDQNETSLRRLSTISDIFAEASQTDSSFYASSRWATCRGQLETEIGPTGIQLTLNARDNLLKRYAKTLPAIIETERTSPSGKSDRYMLQYQNNLSIAHCSERLQAALKECYLSPLIHQCSPAEFGRVILDLATIGGFARGSLLLLDANTQILDPVASLGDCNVAAVSLKERTSEDERQTLIRSSMLGRSPVIEHHLDHRTTAFAGPLGDMQRAGILYLEHTHAQDTDQAIWPRPHFRALRQALIDMMNLD